ncbi:MAG: hypothetical protein NT007_09775 [Candidatus Kapabacteria bacterium]|nr:hypothetical protein [Candidatus Kapabacteria bacterium]
MTELYFTSIRNHFYGWHQINYTKGMVLPKVQPFFGGSPDYSNPNMNMHNNAIQKSNQYHIEINEIRLVCDLDFEAEQGGGGSLWENNAYIKLLEYDTEVYRMPAVSLLYSSNVMRLPVNWILDLDNNNNNNLSVYGITLVQPESLVLRRDGFIKLEMFFTQRPYSQSPCYSNYTNC